MPNDDGNNEGPREPLLPTLYAGTGPAYEEEEEEKEEEEEEQEQEEVLSPAGEVEALMEVAVTVGDIRWMHFMAAPPLASDDGGREKAVRTNGLVKHGDEF